MSNFVIPQNAMIISVEKTAVNEATNQAIKVGQVLDAGTVLVLYPDSQFTVIYLDGSQDEIKPVSSLEIERAPIQNEVIELLSLSDSDLELLDKAIEIETAAGDSVLANHVTQFLASLRNDTAVINAPGLIQAEAAHNGEDFSENLNRIPVSSVLKTTYSPQLTITDPSLSVIDGQITISGTVTDYHPDSSVQIEFSALFFGSEVFQDVSIIDGKYSLVLSTSELDSLPQGLIQLSVKVIENGQTTAVIYQGTTLDTIAPEKPIVSLSQDTNADGILNKQEIGSADNISYRITIADNDLKLGDYLEINGVKFAISPEMLSEQEFSVNVPRGNLQGSVAPEIYLFDAKGNQSDLADISTFTVDTIAPGQDGDIYSAPIIEVQEANSGINLEEASDGTAILVRLPSGTNAGDTVTLTLTLPDGALKPLSLVVNDSQLSTGVVNFEIESAFLLANQGDFSVTAIVTDIAGNDSTISDTFQFASDYEIGNAPSLNVDQVIVQGLNAESIDSVTSLFVTMGDGVKIGDFIKVFINADAQENSILVPILESVVAGEQLQIDIAPLYFTNDGDYEISVELTDQAGNTSARSNGLNVTVDTVAPNAPTIDVPESNNFGVDKSELSNGLDVEITLPSGVFIQDKLTIVLENADGILETITHTITQEDLDTNNVAINFNNHDLSGEQTLDIHAYITDEVGNKSSNSEKFEVIVDTLAPGEKTGLNGTDEKPIANLIEVSMASGDSYINKADYDSVQNGDAVPFTVSLPQGTRFGDYVKFELTPQNGGSSIVALVNIGQKEIEDGFKIIDLRSSILTASTADGLYVIEANVIDKIGNVSATSDAIEFTFDVNAPQIATFKLIDDASSQDITLESNDYSNDALPLIKGTNAESGASIEIFDQDGNSIAIVLANGQGEWEHQITIPLSEGEHQFTSQQTDKAGNIGEVSQPFSVIIDTTAPGTTGGRQGAEDSQGNYIRFNQTDEFINDTEVSDIGLTGFIESNAIINSIVISDGSNPDVIISAGNITVSLGVITVNSIDLSGLNDGELTVSMSITDQARNPGVVSDTIVKHPTEHTIGALTDSDILPNIVASDSLKDTYTGVNAHAEDLDGDEITYQLLDNLDGLLHIDGESGKIFISDPTKLDIQGTVHVAQVIATSSDGSSSVNNFNIEVGSKGIGPIVDIDNSTYPDANDVERDNYISENAPINTEVGIKAQAIDPDLGDTATYTLSAKDVTDNLFAIDANTGVVTLIGNLDFESQISHNITVIATSSDTTSATKTFIINVGNNEYGAGGEGTTGDKDHDIGGVSDSDQINNSLISENAEVGTYVGITVHASDLDRDGISYRMSQADLDNGIFSVDETSGKVTLIGNLDYETTSNHQIIIFADSEDGSVSSSAFTITVGDNSFGTGGGSETGDKDRPIGDVTDIDVANNGPISENALPGTIVGIQAFAQDPDGDTITYSLATDGDNRLFTIHPDNGVVTLAGNLDF